MAPEDDHLNNILATGAVSACFQMALGRTALRSANVVMVDGNATNQVDVEFTFLKSTYRITVERIEEPF